MRLKVIILIFVSSLFAACAEKKTDWDFSLSRNSTEPYGCFLAKEQLENIYPNAEIESQWDVKGYIKEVNKENSSYNNEVIIVVARSFDCSSEEGQEILRFIDNGGTLVFAAQDVGSGFDSVSSTKFTGEYAFYDNKEDSVSRFIIQHNDQKENFDFKGLYLSSHLKPDEDYDHEILGHYFEKDDKKINVSLQKIGRGELILISSPIVFTNYFLLQKENKRYYEYLLSNTHKYPSKVSWSSRTMYSPDYSDNSSSSDSFWGLFKHKAYRAAFWTLLCMGLLYLIFNIKRRQRSVPVKKAVMNDSLAFVETVGQLYFNEKDHPNLARKMNKHYLDYIRTQYNIPARLDEDFAKKLAKKLNRDQEQTTAFVAYLIAVNGMEHMTDTDLKFLYEQLKNYS